MFELTTIWRRQLDGLPILAHPLRQLSDPLGGIPVVAAATPPASFARGTNNMWLLHAKTPV
ncbi:hypothetical protein CK228_21885 [Mesorhizobium sp. WSM4312]|nr:hypothetical protein CK228_21885 [Mesorhizobium sp. WSM4312]